MLTNKTKYIIRKNLMCNNQFSVSVLNADIYIFKTLYELTNITSKTRCIYNGL